MNCLFYVCIFRTRRSDVGNVGWHNTTIEAPDQRFYGITMRCEIVDIMDCTCIVWYGKGLKCLTLVGDVVGTSRHHPIYKHHQ